ncbi:MAG TPA: CsgG/HfaB family protein [Gemmatimonadales bacterium]|nr:CsgG/HfaB family protein [Gemmatimonadales bacterium]
MKRLASGTMALAFAALAFGAGRAQAQQAAATPAAAPQQDTRPGIAVLDFDLGLVLGQDHDAYDALRRGLASLTISELTANPGIRVVERSQLQQILQEQNLGHEGRVDDASLVRIGKLIGAHYMVTGVLFDNKGDMRIDARIFDTETSQILKTSSVRGHLADLYDMVPRLAQQLMHDANLPPLERHAMEEFRQQNPAPPTQAVMAYSRAVLYADRGDKDHAVEQYRRAIAAFPGYTQAKNDCNRLQAGACS